MLYMPKLSNKLLKNACSQSTTKTLKCLQMLLQRLIVDFQERLSKKEHDQYLPDQSQ